MKSDNKLPLLLCLILLCTYSLSQVNAEVQDSIFQDQNTTEQASQKKDFNFFTSEEPLQITLCFNIKEFFKTKNQPEYLDATLMVKINDTDSISQHIKIKARGEMRRTYCTFPPIMLKLYKDSVNNTPRPLGKGTLKLVTECMTTSAYESYLLKEYLAYRLYNLVTPYSFKTRLVKIKYLDINKPNNTYITAYGFLMENEDKMAKRNNAITIDNPNLNQKNMNSEDMARLAVFNYMIGNTDWSIPGQHNVRILQSCEAPVDKGTLVELKGIPVAFDFDYSGLVNSEYAIPCGKGLPIETVTDRYYLGLCYRNEELNQIIDQFAELKERIISTVSDFEYLSKSDKQQVESYIDSFYKMYKNKNNLINDLNSTCKQF